MSLKNYTLIKKIGEGSYGEVWLVANVKDLRKLVLKKIGLHNASKNQRVAARNECELLRSLKHPNIVQYHDSWEENNCIYLAMAYCENGDLYSRLKERNGRNLSEKQIVEWFIQITMAISFLHERNVLHRDLKTQNIFLAKSLVIKVGDLGIAKQLENKNDMAQTLIGTPYYMSPELFSKKPYNFKSDIWALGCVVFEMATLKHAFTARNYNSLSYKIMMGYTPEMPHMYSRDLILLIESMLHKSPEKRPSTQKILRNPFIMEHIRNFLEMTKKNQLQNRSASASSVNRQKIIEPNHVVSSKNRNLILPKPRLNAAISDAGKIDSIRIHERRLMKGKRLSEESKDSTSGTISREASETNSPNLSYSNRRRNSSLNRDNSKSLEDDISRGSDFDIRNSAKNTLLEGKVRGQNIVLHSRPNSAALLQNVSNLEPSENRSDSNAIVYKFINISNSKETNNNNNNNSNSNINNNNINNNNNNNNGYKKIENKPDEVKKDLPKNPTGRERRREQKRFEGHKTLIALDGDDRENDVNDENKEVNRGRNRRNRSKIDQFLILPELIQRKSPENSDSENQKKEVSAVVVKMDETLRMFDVPLNQSSKSDEIDKNEGPTENKEETTDRTRLQNKRYQEIRKEVMKTLGMYKMADAYKILSDIKIDHEKELKRLLGPEQFEMYAGKISWLKMIEEPM